MSKLLSIFVVCFATANMICADGFFDDLFKKKEHPMPYPVYVPHHHVVFKPIIKTVKVPYPVKVPVPYKVKVTKVVKVPVYHKEKYPVVIRVPEKVSIHMKEPIVQHGGYEHGSSSSYGGATSYGGGNSGHGLYSDEGASSYVADKHTTPHGYEYKQLHTVSYDDGKGYAGADSAHPSSYGQSEGYASSKYASLPEYSPASYAGGSEKYNYGGLSGGNGQEYGEQKYEAPTSGYESKSDGHYETGYESKQY